MLRSVVLVITDVSEEYIVASIRATTIDELGSLAITSNRSTLRGVSVASYC
jgi:hypothetical protein